MRVPNRVGVRDQCCDKLLEAGDGQPPQPPMLVGLCFLVCSGVGSVSFVHSVECLSRHAMLHRVSALLASSDDRPRFAGSFYFFSALFSLEGCETLARITILRVRSAANILSHS